MSNAGDLSSIKRQIRRFHIVVGQWTSKKCAKKRDARAELLFWSLNLLLFSLVLKSSLGKNTESFLYFEEAVYATT